MLLADVLHRLCELLHLLRGLHLDRREWPGDDLDEAGQQHDRPAPPIPSGRS